MNSTRSTTFVLGILFATTIADAQPVVPAPPSSVRAWLAKTRTHFAGQSQTERRASWRWRHLGRARRFLDARTIGGSLPTAAQRHRAWELGRDRPPAFVSATGGWTCVGPANVSGRIVDLKFHPTDPSIVYAASASGGLWISHDGGDHWRTTTDALPSLAIGAVCPLPSDPNTILIATGEGLHWTYVVYGAGIWKSTDAGKTWAPTSLTHTVTDNHGFHVMEANPATGTILAGANDGLWRSTDKGDNWVQVRTGGDHYDVRWKPGSANRVYATKGDAASGNGVLVSNDDGLTWNLIGAGLPPSQRISKTKLAVSPTTPSLLYANIGDAQTHGTFGIYRSVDDGNTWTARNTALNISGGQGSYAVTIAVDPDDTQRVIAGGIKLYLSTDGGANFSETGGGNPLGDAAAVHLDQHAIAWEPGSSDDLWIGSDGGPWRSTDSGATWTPKRDGLLTTQFYDVGIDPSDPEFVMGGTQDNGLPWREQEGNPWFPSTLEADGLACFVEPLSPRTIHSEWQFGGHVRSDDRGRSWIPTMNGITGNATAFAPLALDPNQAGHLYTATYDGVFRSLDGQNSWQKVALHAPIWISISPADSQTIWTVGALTGGQPVRYTKDDGANWVYGGPYNFAIGNETKILAHPDDPRTAFVTFAGYAGVAHVARTVDFGQTWQDVSGDFPPDPANTMAIDPRYPDHWFVGTDTGVWFSSNGGVNWAPLAAGFPNVVVYDLEIHAKARHLVAATYGRGIWSIDLPPLGG